MSGINVSRLKQLVSNFSEELASILDEGGLNTTSKKSWKEEADRSIEDLETATSTLSSKTKGELILLSRVAEEVSSSLVHGCESRLDVENEEKFYGEEMTVPVIVVRGPPGTEPVLVDNTPFKGRYDDMESVVYSRISSSSGAGLSNGHTPSPSQVLSIPSKDIPKLRAEVYATPTRSRKVPRPQHTLPPSLSSGPPSPSLSSLSSQSTAESSYSPRKEAGSPTITTAQGRVRRSLRIRGRSEDSDATMSHEASPSMLTGHRGSTVPPDSDSMSHDGVGMLHDSDGASHDPMDELQDTPSSAGLSSNTPKASESASPEHDTEIPPSPPLTVPETPTRTSILRRNGSKDLLSISTEEYFSAQEDIGEGNPAEEKFNADLGGSIIRSDNVDNVIATDIAVKTADDDDDDDGYFMGQASTDESDIEQGSYSTPQNLEAEKKREAAGLNSDRLSPVTPDASLRVEGSRKGQRKGRQERGSIKLPPLSTRSTSPLSTSRIVLDKEVKVVIPKLSHKSLSQELIKFRSPPGLGESPLAHATMTATPEQRPPASSDSECLDVEMASQPLEMESEQIEMESEQVEMDVQDTQNPEVTTPEGSGGEDQLQKGRKSKLKRRKGKPRAEFKVKTEPLSQRFVEDSSSSGGGGGSGTGARASSSPDDITFSDVAYNTIGDSPSEPSSHGNSRPGSSHGDGGPGLSLKPKGKSPLKDLKHGQRSGSASSESRSRSSSVTSNPRTPLLSQLRDEDEDFDKKSPFFRPSRGTQRATPTPKKVTPLKKKKKVLVSISSDEEDEKPLILSSKKEKKVKEKGVDVGEGSSQAKGECISKKSLVFDGDGDIFTFDSDDDDGLGLGRAARRDKGKVKEKVKNWIDRLDGEADIESGEGPSSGLQALVDESLADFEAGVETSTPKKEGGRSQSHGLEGGEGRSSSADRLTAHAPPGRSPLEVNIALKSPLKLGKHAKGPHNKGKEKAQPLPRTIQCLACGNDINWRTKKVHAHPRLNVIICQRCYTVWTTGHFHKFSVDENEIYCSLCGDGGEIVLCDHCDKSFCCKCITRISGKEHLDDLLEQENAEFCCYMCDSSPIKNMQEMCVELTGYFRKSKGGRAGLRSHHTRHHHEESGGVVIGGDGGEGCVVEGGAASGTDSGHNVGEDGERKPISRGGGGSGGGGGGGGGGGSDGGGDGGSGGGGQKKPRKKSTSSFGDFSDSSSESDEGDSPELLTDDVGLSDSSLPGELEEPGGQAKQDRLKRLRKRAHRGNGSPDVEGKQGKAEKDEVEEEDGEGGKKKKKRRRRRSFGDYGSSLIEEEMEDSSESMKVTRRPKRKFSTDSSAEEKVKASQKKSRLAASLSSCSEDDYDALAVELSPGNDLSISDHGSQVTPTKGAANSVKYRIMKPRGLDSSSEDSEPHIVQRKRRKAEIEMSSGEGGAASGAEEKNEKKVEGKAKRRGRKKKVDLSSDEDDFIGKTLTVRGAHGPRRKKINRILLSDSDDSVEAVESQSQEQSDVKEEGEEKEEGEDELNTSFTGRKRKKIRKVIGDAKLAQETKEAKEAEKERGERLRKRKAQEKSGQEAEEERLVLERDPKSNSTVLEVRQSLVPHIKPHQREGIEFLYEACVESLKRLSEGKAGGAILAHCMGLGKTLQVIALADALLTCDKSGVKKVLILCPVNTVNNWKVEFFKWISFVDCDYNVHILSESTARTRLNRLRRWFQSGGIIFMGYEMFRNLALSKRGKKKTREEFCKYLLNPGADMVVCDEGHVMRNSKSSLSLVVNRVKTRLRVVLTGTPLQNNLVEYYTMVNFVKPNLLGTPREFKNQFVNPITNGQCRDSSPSDIRNMRQRAHVLYEILKDTVQRRDFRILAKTLPPKKEYVLNMRLSGVQDQLYRRYLNKGGSTHMASDLFSTFSALAKVWNHPWVLKMDEQRKLEKAEREAWLRSDEEEEEDDTLGGFIVLSDDSEEESCNSRSTSRSASVTEKSVSKSGSSGSPASGPVVISSGEEDLPKISVKSEPTPGESSGAATTKPTDPPPPPPPQSNSKSKSPPPWYDDLVGEGCEEDMDLSGKLLFLFELLEQTRTLKEKVLVFSQSLLTLDLIEEFLSKPQYGDWVPALDYYRLDGSTSADIRTANMASFNKDGNDRLRLFLISTRAGSLGVNLVAANRVVIFDACWNPSHDLQAIFRAYRYGQTKPVFVYRLLAKGTMEEKIYDRQVTKQSLSMRVVDERQIGRHYSSSDLAELFTYTPPPPPDQDNSDKPSSKPEEDLVLCRILEKMQPSWVTGYHEHDSLLEHIDNEELSEEERKAAWASYNQQMSVENARYNLQALQERLEAAPGAGGATATPNQPNNMMAMLAQSPLALFEEFKKQSDLTIGHVRNLKTTMSTLHLLRRRFPNAQVTPRAVQDQIMALDRQGKGGFDILSVRLKQVNDIMMACRASSLTTDATYMSLMERQRVTLYNELEMLRQLPTLSVAAPVLAAGATPPTTSISIQPNLAGGVISIGSLNRLPPHAMGPERTAVTSRPHNQPTPPLGGRPSNHPSGQGPPGSSAANSRNSPSSEVSSTTK